MRITGAEICEICLRERQTRERLAEIPALYLEASAYLEPGRGGLGSSGSRSGRSDGFNWAAMGFRQASDVLWKLEDWERTVRVKFLGQIELDGVDREGEVELNEDGTIKVVVRASNPEQRPIVRRGSVEERVQGVCEFLLVHARWLSKYEAAEDWHREIAEIHGQGMTATKRFVEKVTQIRCPGSVEILDDEGEIKSSMCGKTLTLNENPLARIECKRCGREWTTLRLFAVALETPGYAFWLDSEAIASLLSITPGQVVRISKGDKSSECGQRGDKTYDLIKIHQMRGKAI